MKKLNALAVFFCLGLSVWSLFKGQIDLTLLWLILADTSVIRNKLEK